MATRAEKRASLPNSTIYRDYRECAIRFSSLTLSNYPSVIIYLGIIYLRKDSFDEKDRLRSCE